LEELTRSEKIAGIKMPKGIEAIDDDEEPRPERAPNRQPGLQMVPIDQLEGHQHDEGGYRGQKDWPAFCRCSERSFHGLKSGQLSD
jgi:hypothetical protein